MCRSGRDEYREQGSVPVDEICMLGTNLSVWVKARCMWGVKPQCAGCGVMYVRAFPRARVVVRSTQGTTYNQQVLKGGYAKNKSQCVGCGEVFVENEPLSVVYGYG